MQTKERHVSPAITEFEVERLREENEKLRNILSGAQRLRPALLAQLMYVPECVLNFCNEARAALAEKRA